jgi:hypothetical protein
MKLITLKQKKYFELQLTLFSIHIFTGICLNHFKIHFDVWDKNNNVLF